MNVLIMKRGFKIFNLPLLICFIVLCCGTPNQLFAGSAGQTSAEILRLGSGAVNPAMGTSGVASVSGSSALHYNPAGLAFGRPRNFELTYQQLVEGIDYGNFDFTQRINPRGSIGLAFRYLDYGSLDEVEYQGNLLVPTGDDFSGLDMVGTIGYGEQIRNFAWGFSVKLLHSRIADETATARAVDVGLQWHSMDSEIPLSVGLLLANIGTRVDSIEEDQQGDELPFLGRAGISFDWSKNLPILLKTNVDVEYDFESEKTAVMAGLEWSPVERVALRLGLDGTVDADDGLTAGVGLGLSDDLQLDYAFVPHGDLGDLHIISLQYSQGSPSD